MTMNKTWYLRQRPVGEVSEQDLELVSEEDGILEHVPARTVRSEPEGSPKH